MFDVLRNQYRMRCPLEEQDTWVAVSDFRSVKRLRGAASPAVFRVTFDCTCGVPHESLITHETLDYQPLGTETTATFTNLLTGSRELLSHELGSINGDLIRKGAWPWTFYCHPESAQRPAFPSALRMISPLEDYGDQRVGVLVRCLSCTRMTVNLVTKQHLDVPFHNDEVIHFVDRVMGQDQVSTEEAFRHQLESGRYIPTEIYGAA